MDSGQIFIACFIAPAVIFCLIGVVISAVMAWRPGKLELRSVVSDMQDQRRAA